MNWPTFKQTSRLDQHVALTSSRVARAVKMLKSSQLALLSYERSLLISKIGSLYALLIWRI